MIDHAKNSSGTIHCCSQNCMQTHWAFLLCCAHEDHQPSGAVVVHGCFLVGHTKMIAGDHLVDFMSQLTMFLKKVVGVSFACHHHSGGAIRKKRCINNCRIAVVNGEATAIDQVFQRCSGWGDNVHGDRCRPRRKDELQ